VTFFEKQKMEYIDTYRGLLVHKPQTFRGRLRGLALTTVATGYKLMHNQEELLGRPRIQFLYIHHTFRDEMDALSELLLRLSRDHQFITYSEGVRRVRQGNIDRPYVCISSDDGLKNNLEAAAILDRVDAKGCFFICPSIVGEKNDNKIRDFARQRLHFPPVEFMTWKDVELLQKNGHEIGGHTMSHINIAETPKDMLGYEIAMCREIIHSRCGGAEHFAFPYGRLTDFSEYGRRMVFDSGFQSCASAERGCHIVCEGQQIPSGDLLIRRDHVILAWPLEHILYFIARNAARADLKNNFFPPLCA
jgi:peptidoglycan/xylan/chitin deacetylase (PgdA/CDA1 family)